MKKGGLEYRDEDAYESVQFIGYFRKLMIYIISIDMMKKKEIPLLTDIAFFVQGTMSKSMNYYRRPAAVVQQLTTI